MKINNRMKKAGIFLLVVLSAFLISSCNDDQRNAENEDAEKTEEIVPENLDAVEIKVNGMTCEGCEKAIENSIYKLSGINHTQISHLDSSAVVEFDKTKTNVEEIKKAIRNAGYKVAE